MNGPASNSGVVVKIGIADKSPLIHAALRHLLAEDSRFELVSICSDGETFLKNMAQRSSDIGVIGWIIAPGDGKYILDQLRGIEKVPRTVVHKGAESTTVPSRAMTHEGDAFHDYDRVEMKRSCMQRGKRQQ